MLYEYLEIPNGVLVFALGLVNMRPYKNIKKRPAKARRSSGIVRRSVCLRDQYDNGKKTQYVSVRGDPSDRRNGGLARQEARELLGEISELLSVIKKLSENPMNQLLGGVITIAPVE